MSIKYYDGGYKDIIMSIPTNTIEMTIKLKMYEDGEMLYAKQIFDLNDIKDAEDLFEQCCDGISYIYPHRKRQRIC